MIRTAKAERIMLRLIALRNSAVGTTSTSEYGIGSLHSDMLTPPPGVAVWSVLLRAGTAFASQRSTRAPGQ